jgi:outer membrane murein-binding lipoprotein Lpp
MNADVVFLAIQADNLSFRGESPMKKSTTLMIGAVVTAGLLLAGCSSNASQEELRQLEELKAEVASMEKEVQNLESEKARLQTSIADKDAQLKKCNDDKMVVGQRLKGM